MSPVCHHARRFSRISFIVYVTRRVFHTTLSLYTTDTLSLLAIFCGLFSSECRRNSTPSIHTILASETANEVSRCDESLSIRTFFSTGTSTYTVTGTLTTFSLYSMRTEFVESLLSFVPCFHILHPQSSHASSPRTQMTAKAFRNLMLFFSRLSYSRGSILCHQKSFGL